MQLTKNFHLDEFRSKDGAEFPEDVLVNVKFFATVMQVIRDYLGKPITITSGYRSPQHNAKIKGAKNSTHLKGIAADFKVKGMSPAVVVYEIEEMIDKGLIPQGGLKAYSSWIHYDIRGTKARW